MADDPTPVFQIQRIYLKDLSLEIPHAPQIFLEQTQPTVEVALDTANEARGLTVPTGAVVEIEGKKGVFVPATSASKTDGSQSFAFRPVKLGRESNNRLEIASGLAEGETVVSKNAFILKSELILQNETEEE